MLHPGQAEADLRKARAAAERAGGPKVPGALLQFMDDSRAEGEVRENAFLCQLYPKSDHFAKTDSGQA